MNKKFKTFTATAAKREEEEEKKANSFAAIFFFCSLHFCFIVDFEANDYIGLTYEFAYF